MLLHDDVDLVVVAMIIKKLEIPCLSQSPHQAIFRPIHSRYY
jgi:hypothetical protein